MTTHQPAPTPGEPPEHRRPLPRPAAAAALFLLALPVVVLLAVPLYARDRPELFGFPFFYWFQMAAVPVASALTYGAWLIVSRARRPAPGTSDGGR